MPLKTSKELTDETVKLIARFKSGKLKPIPTGIPHLDEALLGGLLPSSCVGIIGRSQHGKTYDIERIQRHILDNNPDVIYLNCNWEMEYMKLLIRDISQRTGDSVKKVLFDPLTEETTKEFKDICDKHRVDNIYYQNEPVSDEEFAQDVEGLISKYPDKKIVITIDNLENILRTKGTQKDCMDALLYQINVLKKKHPFICFIILNQMNREYLSRMDNIKNQKPNELDVYGSDQLLKLCDVAYIKMIPWKLGIRDRFMIFGDNQYSWLEDHKIENGNRYSFDPFGRAYYFYIKQRQPEDEKNIKDVFVEVMFTKEETNYKEEKLTPTTKEIKNIPVFTEPEQPFDSVKFNMSPEEAFGTDEEPPF